MLNDKLILSLTIFNFTIVGLAWAAGVAPILDIENESIGYLGQIGERNVLVDLKPHLEIKNLDQINGICSYHVFKPNNEEFPFTIDIKDKTTGEAVIEVVKKEIIDSTTSSSTTTVEIFSPLSSNTNKPVKQPSILLDCNKRKEFNFLIQAHDCSTPSLSSKKIPVKIEIIDHDDYELKFSQDVYKKTLIKSNSIYENFMQVEAKDQDCTNNGYACAYKLLKNDLSEINTDFPFVIDNTGRLSTTRSIQKGDLYEFVVRAFDCVTKSAYVDAKIIVDVIDECSPQWTDFTTDVNPLTDSTTLFDTLKTTSCEFQYKNAFLKPEQKCDIDQVKSKIIFDLDDSIKSQCQSTSNVFDIEKCKVMNINNVIEGAQTTEQRVLFSVNKNKLANDEDDVDDDTIEDLDSQEIKKDENSIVKLNELKKPGDSLLSSLFSVQKQPINYRSFSKETENAQKIENFNGQFGQEFTLSVWVRRPANADRTIKEQVFCGTDSHAMNRHHYGVYFYRGNFKFLLRKEPSGNQQQNEIFYPSLWEWALPESILTDNKWHFYEIKFNYPNASLFIDGVKFVETSTNSDIVDAYELSDVKESGPVTTYVGACFHSRTGTLLDHFEGDIAELVLTRKSRDLKKEEEIKKQNELKCKQMAEKSAAQASKSCPEYIEMNMVGNENYLSSIESSTQFEINVKTTNMDDMTQLIRKLNYINKNSKNSKEASRSIRLATQIRCSNTGREIKLNDLYINLNLKQQKQEYNVQLEGVKQLFTTPNDLENGLEPFKDISILKIPINKVDENDEDDDEATSMESSEEQAEEIRTNDDISSSNKKDIQLSKCQIKIVPQRNLIDPSVNSEKIMFLQNLLDQFNFKFEETINTVTISGIQSAENYETFIRKLTYLIGNVNEVEQEKLKLIKNKQFYITCYRNEPNIETNTILVQLNVTIQDTQVVNENGFIAHKQAQRLVVSEFDDDVTRSELVKGASSSSSETISSKTFTPITVAAIVLASCVIGSILVFGVIKIHTSRFLQGGRRKQLINEENPQMEWDDSGLNITENPLDNMKINKDYIYDDHENHQLDYEGDEYTTSEEEDGDEEEDEEDGQSYSSEEETGKVVVERELEWDDESLEIKQKKKQLQLEMNEIEENRNSNNSNNNNINLNNNNNCNNINSSNFSNKLV